MEDQQPAPRRVRGRLAAAAFALVVVAAAAYQGWNWWVRGVGRKVADAYVDAVLTGNHDRAMALRFHPALMGKGTAAEAFMKYPRMTKSLDYCPMTEFCRGKVAQCQVTVLGPTSFEQLMQAAPDGSRMESVWQVPFRYKVALGSRAMTFDVILHGLRAPESGDNSVRWYVFNVNNIQ